MIHGFGIPGASLFHAPFMPCGGVVRIRCSPTASCDVSYSDPPLGASCFSCQTSAISAGRQRLSEGHHALPGPPDGAGLLLMDPAEVPDQSEWR